MFNLDFIVGFIDKISGSSQGYYIQLLNVCTSPCHYQLESSQDL